MLAGLRISSKLMIMVGVSVVGIAIVASISLSTLRDNLLEDRKAKLHDLVLLARQAVDLDYQASKKAGLSDAEAFERGRALLRTLRFGKDDYFYAFNAQGVVQAHPNPQVENKNLYNAPDSDGVYFTRQQIELAAQGGGFVAYRFPRAGGTGRLAAASISMTSMQFSGSRFGG
jgi:methyl-accepting chemotaxis protein